MITSNYRNVENPTDKIKKKFVKENINTVAPPIKELAGEIFTNKTATVPNDYDEKKDSLITGGNYAEDIGEVAVDPKILKGGDGKPSDKWGTGTTASKVTGAATGALSMVGSVMGQKGPMTKAESGANTLNLAAQGAQAGSAFGIGGTIVGGLAGGLTGLVMGAGDEKELDDKAKVERLALLDKTKNDRMKAQKLEEGKASIEKSRGILESQMGMLKSNYKTT